MIAPGKCDRCDGPPMAAGAYNRATGKYDLPVACEHVCPKRAESGDTTNCYCCEACMRACNGARSD